MLRGIGDQDDKPFPSSIPVIFGSISDIDPVCNN